MGEKPTPFFLIFRKKKNTARPFLENSFVTFTENSLILFVFYLFFVLCFIFLFPTPGEMKLFEVFVCSVFFLGLLGRAQTWPCAFTSGNQSYDFTSQSSCTDTSSTTCSSGMYRGVDSGANEYYFKLCDPVTTTPNEQFGSSCQPNTQVCQQDGNLLDVSCGVGPPTYSLISATQSQGVVQATTSGDLCSGKAPRSTKLNLKCPSAFGKKNNDIDTVIENPMCNYEITLYIDAACGVGPLCCTYKSDTGYFALCSTESECPNVTGYSVSSQKSISDCSSCTPDIPSTLDCCLYQSSGGELMGQCTSDGICPLENGYTLISQYPTTDCDTCNPIS